MTLERPLFMEPLVSDPEIDYTAYNFRSLLDGVFSAEGPLSASDCAVSQRAAGANMSVDVSAGIVVIQGQAGNNQGKYLCRSTAVTNLAVPAAPSSGSRQHRVVARIYDKQWDANSNASPYSWAIELLTDTGAGLPAEPSSAVTLAVVTVNAGAASVTNSAISQSIVFGSRSLARVVGVPPIPIVTTQSADPSFNATGVTRDFASSSWAPINFVFPASGVVHVSISADVRNTNTPTSTVWAAWRVTGGGSGGVGILGTPGLSAEGNSRVYATQRLLVLGTPGAAASIIPTWLISSGDNTTAQISNGALEVEFV